MITYKSKNRAFAAVLAGTAIAAACPAWAAPVLTNTAAVKQVLASDVQEVRWRGGRVVRLGGPLAGGLLGGGLASTAFANPCCYDYASYPNPYAPKYIYAYPAYGYDERGAAWWYGVGWRGGWGPGWSSWR